MKRQRRGVFPPQSERHLRSVLQPVRRDDLVVNKSRLNDLNDWLDRSLTSTQVPLLLLCGPAGCGKSCSIKVLASEKDIQIFEWSTPIDTSQNWDDLEWIKPVKVSSRFKEFLFGVGRYLSVIGVKQSDKKLVIVKDFPTIFLTNPEEFREIIDEYVLKGRTPIVFICTDSPNKKSKDIAYELFPDEFRIKHNITVISLLSAPVTSVTKALKRTVQITGKYVNDDLLKEIAVESRGDIRKALNDLILFSVGSSKTAKIQPEQKKQKKGQKDKHGTKTGTEDESVGLFHSVGRILYAKRVLKEESESPNNLSDSELIHKPEDIVKQFSHYANQVVNLAHSNYLDIFSSIDCITNAATYLSDADLVMAEWREKELLTTIGFTVAVAGFMESNRNPIRRFRPIQGSKWNEDLKVARANHIRMHAMFTDYSASRVNICLEVIPFLRLMWKAKNMENSSVKQCSHGFLPHKSDDMFCTLRKIKSEMLSPTLLPLCSDVDEDPIHISDDSE